MHCERTHASIEASEPPTKPLRRADACNPSAVSAPADRSHIARCPMSAGHRAGASPPASSPPACPLPRVATRAPTTGADRNRRDCIAFVSRYRDQARGGQASTESTRAFDSATTKNSPVVQRPPRRPSERNAAPKARAQVASSGGRSRLAGAAARMVALTPGTRASARARRHPSPGHPPRAPAPRHRARRHRGTPRRPRTDRSASARWTHR